MRVLLCALMLPLLVACSTTHAARSRDVSETSVVDVGGRWRGHWTGTGLFHSMRDDTLVLELAQHGPRAQGRIVMEGTGAAEAVPMDIRRAGLWGSRVFALISADTVTLRHHVDGRLFTAELRVSEDGEQMSGLVRGAWPPVGLVLSRERSRPAVPDAPSAPPQAATTVPEPAPLEAAPTPIEAAPVIAAVEPEPTPAPPVETAMPARPRQDEFEAVPELTAVHFDFDRADLRADARDRLQAHTEWLKQHPDAAVLIEGHCDERGTAEYNVALGERRARSVRDHLAAHGIEEDRLSTVSYGKERLACPAGTEDCHGMNRRAEFRVKSR
jgi:peptidoglycan-associated lipoprotein